METSDYVFLNFFLEKERFFLLEESENKADLKTDPPEADFALTLPFYGSNKKQILVVLNYAKGDLLKSPEYSLLLKIMEAVKLTLHELAIFNLAEIDASTSIQNLNDFFSPKKLVVFGNLEGDISFPIALDRYQPIAHEHFEVLKAHSLAELLEDVEKKKLLWAALQKFF